MMDNAEKNARTLDLTPPWGFPAIVLTKSDGHPWSLLFCIHTDEYSRDHHHTFTWLVALKTAWPPIFLFRGWIQWD